MNTIFGIPCTDFPTSYFEAITAVKMILQKCGMIFCGLIFHKLRSNPHTAVTFITAVFQYGVDFFLRKGKSEGRYSFALRFVDIFDLFGFGQKRYVIKQCELFAACRNIRFGFFFDQL